MTLEEAIEHYKEVESKSSECCSYKDEHRQIGEWLSELKEYKDREQREIIDRLSAKLHKFTFHLLVEGNDNCCMYQQKTDDVEFFASSTLDAYTKFEESIARIHEMMDVKTDTISKLIPKGW